MKYRPESKIMMNSVKPRTKRSKVERLMNKQIIVIFILQILLCIFSALYYTIWFEDNEVSLLTKSFFSFFKDDLDYLDILQNSKDTKGGYNFGTRFGNWMLIFS